MQGRLTDIILTLYIYVCFLYANINFSEARSTSALEPGWESWVCSPGEEKDAGRPQSPFQCLKGLQESWRGTWDEGLERQDKKKWF